MRMVMENPVRKSGIWTSCRHTSVPSLGFLDHSWQSLFSSFKYGIAVLTEVPQTLPTVTDLHNVSQCQSPSTWGNFLN